MRDYSLRTLKNKHLSQNFATIGQLSLFRSQENLDIIGSTPGKLDHIDITALCASLRKTLLVIQETSRRGGTTIFFSRFNIPNDKLPDFIQSWRAGLISNFKKVNSNLRRLPSLVIVLTNDAFQQNRISWELKRCQVGAIVIHSTNAKGTGLFNIPGNTSNELTSRTFKEFFIKATTNVVVKEINELKQRQFPRLGSNQRPRT
jgi:hypothetical protein